MRVVAGSLGGRIFESPHGHRTRPMSEKMRGAIFSALGDIEGLTVLDAFSGSGALAIEAVSRGAKNAVAIDADKGAHNIITKNIKNLGIENQVKAVRVFASAWSTRNQASKFDLVLLDPPYYEVPYRDLLRLPKHLAANGTMVLSWPGKSDPGRFEGLEMIRNKTYGDSQLFFYKHIDKA